MKNKLIIIVLSFLSTTVMAETMLFIEQKDKQLIFIQLNKKPNFQYYATWSNKKNSCIATKPLGQSFPLKKEISLDNKYTFPNKHGFLCLRRSKDLLPEKWNRYHVFTTIPLSVATQELASITTNNMLRYENITLQENGSDSIANQSISSIIGESIIINHSKSINMHPKALDIDKKEIKISAVALSPERLKKESNLLECKLKKEKGRSFCQIKL